MSNKSANTIESFAIWGKTSDNHPLQCDAHINMFLPIRTNIDIPSIDMDYAYMIAIKLNPLVYLFHSTYQTITTLLTYHINLAKKKL